MIDATRAELQAALGSDWHVVNGTLSRKLPPRRMRLYDFKRTLYVGAVTGRPYRWVLWDGIGTWFGAGDDVIDVTAMAADLRAFVAGGR
jgi:hypothetical protein